MKKAFLPVLTFGKIAIKRAFRDKTAMFFLFLFPLIFLFIFGGLFGKNNSASFKVAVFNKSDTVFAKNFENTIREQKAVNAKPVDSFDDARAKMGRGELDSILEIPADFGKLDKNGRPTGNVEVYYSEGSPDAGRTFASLVEGAIGQINIHLVHDITPLSVVQKSTKTSNLTRFDYTFAGLLGFTVIGLGIFGPVNYFPELKKQGVLRRLHTTPLRVWQYFLANVLSQAVIGLFSVLLMFIVAILVFHLKVNGNVLELALFIVLSIVTILGIGLAIGGWAKDQNQSAPLTNIIVFPMFFLSGTFFPRYLMPLWLQKISTFLPLTPVIDGIRLIATEGRHLWQIGPQLGLMALWIIVVYLIAFRAFRWE
jgi:ABC-2 type transport system permease protein